MKRKITFGTASAVLALGLVVGTAVPAMAAQKLGYKTGCSSESPVAVKAHTTGNGNIRTYDKYGNNDKTAFFSGSTSTYLFHYSASQYLSEANWEINTGGAIDNANSYAYCAV